MEPWGALSVLIMLLCLPLLGQCSLGRHQDPVDTDPPRPPLARKRTFDDRQLTSADIVEIVKLVASDAEANDLFGISVCVFEDLVVVGAHGDDSSRGGEPRLHCGIH